MGIQAGQEPEIVTIHEAARMMSRTVKAVRRMIEKNKIAVVRPDRRVYIPRTEINRFLSVAPLRGGNSEH